MNRRKFIESSAIALITAHITGCKEISEVTHTMRALQKLDSTHDGLLGVSVVSAAQSFDIVLQDNEAVLNSDASQNNRFALCSTFKLPLAAMILRDIDQGTIAADTRIPIRESDILSYAPVTEKHLTQGYMSVINLAEAAQKTSDNTAANLLLSLIGGPSAFTKRMRLMGDETTRLDRIEPELNLVRAGEIRDTTTAHAMARSLQYIFESDYLSINSRALMKQWMIDTRTGLQRVRAGIPDDWVAGDKTGTGIAPSMVNKHNDIGVIWPPHHPPLYYAAYYESDAYYEKPRPRDDEILSNIGKIIAEIYRKP